MKKFVVFILLVAGFSGFAQERGERRSNMTSSEMAKLNVERMAMRLNLNEEQKEKLIKIKTKHIEDRREQMQDQKENMEDGEIAKNLEKFRAQQQQLNDKMLADIKEILTAEQYQKYIQIQKERQERRERFRRQN